MALAGCGSSSSAGPTYSVEADTTVTTASIAQARFIPRVNEICHKAWAKILSNFAEYSGWHNITVQKKGPFVEAVQVSLLAGIDFHIFDQIYRLGAPQGEEHEVEEIIGSLQSAVERGQKNLAPIASVAQISKLFSEYNQRARQYGFDECPVDRARLRGIGT